MSSREILAKAHARMTPEQIATHALGLCDVIDAYSGVHGSLQQLATSQHDSQISTLKLLRTLQGEVKRAATLLATGKLADGAALVAHLAKGELAAIPKPLPADLFLPMPPQSLFDPAE